MKKWQTIPVVLLMLAMGLYSAPAKGQPTCMENCVRRYVDATLEADAEYTECLNYPIQEKFAGCVTDHDAYTKVCNPLCEQLYPQHGFRYMECLSDCIRDWIDSTRTRFGPGSAFSAHAYLCGEDKIMKYEAARAALNDCLCNLCLIIDYCPPGTLPACFGACNQTLDSALSGANSDFQDRLRGVQDAFDASVDAIMIQLSHDVKVCEASNHPPAPGYYQALADNAEDDIWNAVLEANQASDAAAAAFTSAVNEAIADWATCHDACIMAQL